MRASTFAILLGFCVGPLAAATASGESFSSLGYREDTVIESDGRDDCVGALVYNHDYSFENAYCWQYEGLVPPYYGALGEAFDVGPAMIECGIYWFTQIGYMWPQPTDIYVWDGGMNGPPSGVLCLVPDVILTSIGYWPDCGENDIQVGCCVSGAFTIGYWQLTWNPGGICPFYVCADENGGGGHSWTCIAPGIGYPSGWQHPNVVWPNCRSLGIGATIIETPSPAESRTWGSIKALFE